LIKARCGLHQGGDGEAVRAALRVRDGVEKVLNALFGLLGLVLGHGLPPFVERYQNSRVAA